jgi:putative FmdB family regulatory protein
MARCRPDVGWKYGIRMPIYEFECTSCGHHFDRLQKMSDEDPTICPTCGLPQLRRKVVAPSFRLAGSGWYETDFKKDSDKKRNLAEAPGDSNGPKQDAAPKPADTPTPAAAAPAPAPAPAAAPAPSSTPGSSSSGS